MLRMRVMSGDGSVPWRGCQDRVGSDLGLTPGSIRVRPGSDPALTLLLLPQGDERVDSRRAPGRHQSRHQRQRRQEQRRSAKRHAIGRADFVKESAHPTRKGQRRENAQPDPGARKQQRPTHHRPDDLRGASPERHPHANLVRLLADDVGEHAVDTNRREPQRNEGETVTTVMLNRCGLTDSATTSVTVCGSIERQLGIQAPHGAAQIRNDAGLRSDRCEGQR